MINVGIVGCGRIIEEGHAPAFAKLSDRFRVVAVADPSAARRDLIADRFAVPARHRYSDWQDLLALAEVDLVDMALPHFLHLPSLQAAAAAGKAVLMEKPMATSMAEADSIMAAVADSGRPACLIHNYLWRPEVRLGLELIRSGAIGRPHLFRSEGFSPSHYPGAAGYDPDWRTKSARGGGGAIIDNAYHYCYMSEALLDSPVEAVYAGFGTFVHEIDVEDLGLIQLSHANGSFSLIAQGWTGPGQAVSEVHGAEGVLTFPRFGQGRLTIQRGSETETVDVDGEINFGFEGIFAEYAATLESGGPPPVEFSAGYRNLQIVMAAYESGQSGQAVRL